MISEMDLALSNLKRLRHFRNWLIWGFLPGVLLISNLVGRVTHLAYSFFICLRTLDDWYRVLCEASAALALS